jgi:hypothetical protein
MPYPHERLIDTEGFPNLAVKISEEITCITAWQTLRLDRRRAHEIKSSLSARLRPYMMDFIYAISAAAWSAVIPLSAKAGMFGGFSAFLPFIIDSTI